jgi:hypothetical protein
MKSCLSVLMLLAAIAQAEEATVPATDSSVSTNSGQVWSAIGGRTLGEGSHVIDVRAGWSGASVGYQRGVAPQFDVGGRFGFIFAQEGMVNFVSPGLKATAQLKLRLLDQGAISVALLSDPGFFLLFPPGQTIFGLVIPVGVRLGIAASSAVGLSVGFDVPFWVGFGPLGSVNVPFLTGVGVEYFITSNLNVFATVRMGPTVRSFGTVSFTLEAVLGVDIKLP